MLGFGHQQHRLPWISSCENKYLLDIGIIRKSKSEIDVAIFRKILFAYFSLSQICSMKLPLNLNTIAPRLRIIISSYELKSTLPDLISKLIFLHKRTFTNIIRQIDIKQMSRGDFLDPYFLLNKILIIKNQTRSD